MSTEQQTGQAQVEELKARAGLYGTEAQKNQLQVDQMRKAQQMFSGGAQPGVTPAQPAQPGDAQQPAQPQQGSWLPTSTPQQLAPIVGAMIPSDLSEDEKPLIESAASAGAQKARETGMISDYLGALNKGVADVSNRRLQLTQNPDKQPLTDDDRKQFKEDVLPSMENLSPSQKKLASAAIDGAKTQKDKEALTQRLMAQDAQAQSQKIANANRISNENLQHNLQLDKDGRDKIIANNQKWSDAQTQIELGNRTIQAAGSGDDLATRVLPTMEVLGINMTGGIKRISPTEAAAAQIPVSWTNRFNQWVDSRTSGATDAELLREGKRLFGDLADARYTSYLSEQKSVASNYKMSPKDVSVIDNNGQSVTLDKAAKAGPRTAAPAGAAPGGLSPEAKAYLKSQGLPVPE